MTKALEQERIKQLADIAEDLELELGAARDAFHAATAEAREAFERSTLDLAPGQLATALRALDAYWKETRLERQARHEAETRAYRRHRQAAMDVERYYSDLEAK